MNSRLTFSVLSFRVWELTSILFLLPMCSRPEAGTEVHSGTEAPWIDLLEHVESAALECPVLTSPEPADQQASAGRILFDPLDRWPSAEWKTADKAPLSSVRAAVDPVDGRALVHAVPSSGGIHRLVPVRDFNCGLRVQIHARPAAGGQAPRLSIVSLPRDVLDLEAALKRRPALAVHEVAADYLKSEQAPEQSPWQELCVDLPPDRLRSAVLVSLIPGPSGAGFRELSVQTLDFLTSLGLSRRVDAAALGATLHRRVRLEGQDLDSLLLPCPARAQMKVAIGARRPRLCFDLGAFAAADSHVQLELLADGMPVFRARLSALDSGLFRPVEVPLQEFAGRSIDLQWVASGGAGNLALVGAPELLCSAGHGKTSVIVLSLDTLRADELGCYGAANQPTPALDGLAAEGALFERVISPVSWTMPAHFTIFTGQNPLVHELTDTTRRLDRVRSPLLALELHRRGYATAAFTGGGYVDPVFGLSHGFPRYVLSEVSACSRKLFGPPPELDAGQTRFAGVESILQWIDQHQDVPFFLFLHTYFVHNFRPTPRFLEAVDADCTPPDRIELAEVERRARVEREPLATSHLRHRYQATVREVDAHFVRPLIDHLRSLELFDRVLLCVVSDHGEQFNEHGNLYHGLYLWGELVKVPWILRGPGVPGGLRVEESVRLEDVSPTVLGLLGIPADKRMTGLDVLRTTPSSRRLMHLGLSRISNPRLWEAIEDGPWKILRSSDDPDRPVVHLYRIDQDPSESTDLFGRDPEAVRRMLESLDQTIRSSQELALSIGGSTLPHARSDVTIEVLRRQLEELGYMSDH